MQRKYIFIVVLSLALLSVVYACSTRSVTNPNEQVDAHLTQSAILPQTQEEAAPLQQELSKMETKDDIYVSDSLEPVISGKLSHDLGEAEGKNMTRVEYRYVSSKGELLSVVASINESRRIDDITVTEKSSQDAEAKIYKKGNSVPDYNSLRELLYDMHTYQKNVGLITWNNAPERPNWKDDISTTWVIVHFGDIQYIISSRQDLPKERYEAFNRLYTYLTSFVRGFDRKMTQDIGEPAPPVIKMVHGKEVRLVPGTGNSVQAGADIDYGDKKWWIEEEFNATFRATPDSLKLCEGPFMDEAVTSAEISIDNNGNFVLHINKHEFIGSLDRTRKYGVMADAYYANNDEMSRKKMEKNGYLDSGKSFWIDYHEGEGYDDYGESYKRLVLKFKGEPYVHGRAIEPNTIVLERK